MTRMERLLRLVNLFKVRDKITLKELIDESRVSKRTIYRDLEMLSRMNIPIKYDNGYYLAGEVSMPTFNFTEEEKELIGCSLKCSPLMKLPRFREMINDIEHKILASSQNVKGESLNNYLFGIHDETDVFAGDESIFIGRFIKSLESKEQLNVLLKNGESLVGMIPKALNIMENSWEFSLYEQNEGTVQNISIQDISKLESVKMVIEEEAEVEDCIY